MADTAVAITAGTGTNIDTRTEGTNGNHRQVIVIGDPATNAGVAPVDATNGLAVYNVQALTVATHAVTLAAGATAIAKAEDVASADADVGVPSMAVRKATPANTSGTDGDYEMLQMSAGRLWTNSLLGDGTNAVAVKAASTAPAATDPALVVSISPNSVNANGQATMANSAPVVPASNWPGSTALANFGAGEYETVAASQTDQVMGASGAAGDYLAGVLIVPASTSPGAVSIKDGAGSAITIFAGGASSVSNLVPFFVPLSIICATSWKITTGSSVSAIGIGNFT